MGGFKHLKYCGAVCAAAAVWLCLGVGARDARAEGPRHAAMIIDANTGKVLHDANADEPRYPASLTKLMTLYLVFEALDQGRLQLDSELIVSEAAASVAPSKLELAPGETIKLADAIKALVTKSANDMAVAVAEKIAGNERSFAELMTKRARQIGMNSTTFRNASGLPDSAQQTTARDMLTLALRIYDDFPDRARVFSLREFTYQGKTYRTHNTLMKSFAGMDGMKTGYTSASGFNLVASVHRDGKHLVAAVFGGATASARNAHMRQILNHALDDASTDKTRVSKPQLIASVRPAARPQRDEARPQRDEARPQREEARPQKDAEWPQVKVAASAPAPKPAARPAVKLAEAVPKPAAASVAPTVVANPAPAPVASVSVVPPVQANSVPAPQQSITVTPPPATPAAAEPAQSVPAQSVSVPPPIAIASVRTVSITPVAPVTADTVVSTMASPPLAGEPAQQSVSLTPPPVAAAAATPKLDFAALRRAIVGSGPSDTAPPPTAAAASRTITPAPAATAPAASDETIMAKAAPVLAPAARVPSTLEEQVALLDSASATAPDNLPATATPVAFAAPARSPLTPARAPSTLGAQAASITEPVNVAKAAPTMHLSGPQGQPPASSAAAPAIQIGAYASPQEAERQLASVQARAQAALTGTTPISRRVESGGRQLYAARFVGLNQAAATKACLELRQKSIDCFVVQSK